MVVRAIGRERELEATAQLVSGLDAGAGALILEGEPGIGKTTVFNDAVAHARGASVVLSCRPAKAEAPLGFTSLTDLLEPVIDDVMPSLPEPQQGALAVAMLRAEPEPGGLNQRGVSAAALSAVRALTRQGPLLIAIDDLQWLDRPSARVLEFALRRVDALPVGILVCERLGEDSRVPLDVHAAVADERCTRVRLGPLSLAALQRILKERLGRTFSRRALLRIERAAGGNPFFALELARVLPADPSTAAALPIPDSLLDLVEARIAGLPRRSRDQILLVAAVGSPTVNLVLSATPSPRAEALAALERSVDAGVATIEGDRVSFRHPLYAEGVYSAASARERREAHARLAGLVDGIEERARHLALAASGPDPELASTLDAAAERARRRGAPDAAAELAERALLLTPADNTESRLRRTITAANYRYHAGELQRAREMGEVALQEATSSELRAAALRLLGDVHAHDENLLEANRMFEEALEEAGDDLEMRTGLEHRLTYGLNVLGDFDAIVPHAQRAVEAAERLGDTGAFAEALAVGAIADCMVGRGIDENRVDEALRLEDQNRETPVAFRPSLIAGCLSIYAGRLERAVRILRGLRERLLERGEETDVPFVSGQLVWAECWRGRLSSAAAYADESVETATRIQAESMRCLSLAFSAVSAAHAGDPEPTRRLAAECRELAPRTNLRIAVLWAAWAEAVLALSLDDPESAHAALAPLAVPFEEAVPDPARAFFLRTTSRPWSPSGICRERSACWTASPRQRAGSDEDGRS